MLQKCVEKFLHSFNLWSSLKKFVNFDLAAHDGLFQIFHFEDFENKWCFSWHCRDGEVLNHTNWRKTRKNICECNIEEFLGTWNENHLENLLMIYVYIPFYTALLALSATILFAIGIDNINRNFIVTRGDSFDFQVKSTIRIMI